LTIFLCQGRVGTHNMCSRQRICQIVGNSCRSCCGINYRNGLTCDLSYCKTKGCSFLRHIEPKNRKIIISCFVVLYMCFNSVQQRLWRILVKFSIMHRKPYFTPQHRCTYQKKKNSLLNANWHSNGYLRYDELTLPCKLFRILM